jgi:phosphoglycerol transferase MdoB-like AlkP superfamily enzyme
MLAGTALARPQLTETDSARFGLAGAMWLHALAERKPLPPLASPFLNIRSSGDEKPPIVAVQSESFFDARRLHPAVARGVLERFDQLAREADCGRLAVPVWGAYTMRSEFAFLSGIPQAELGIHRFNPYRRLARGGVATLASALRARGYRTLCLHPYPAGFFARDRVFPALGFDAFVDLAGFAGAERAGPYIADAEVTARICRALEEASGPLFIFAITMENHGPLHLERATAAEAQELYAAEPPPGFDDLTVYLRHLRHADDMIGTLAQALSRKPGLLCFYGDHVPGLPSIYRALDYHDSRTDYLIWNFRNRESRRADLPVERLGLRLLERAGLARAPA